MTMTDQYAFDPCENCTCIAGPVLADKTIQMRTNQVSSGLIKRLSKGLIGKDKPRFPHGH